MNFTKPKGCISISIHPSIFVLIAVSVLAGFLFSNAWVGGYVFVSGWFIVFVQSNVAPWVFTKTVNQ